MNVTLGWIPLSSDETPSSLTILATQSATPAVPPPVAYTGTSPLRALRHQPRLHDVQRRRHRARHHPGDRPQDRGLVLFERPGSSVDVSETRLLLEMRVRASGRDHGRRRGWWWW